MTVSEAELAFPAQLARTRRFTLGVPRSFAVASAGSRVAFLRSRAGDDPVTCLWVLDVDGGGERLIADPLELLGGADEGELSDAERARRERARESATGIVAFGGDRELRRAAFALGGRLFLADLISGGVSELRAPGPVDDPRIDPTGRRVAYVVDGALHVQEADGVGRVLAADGEPDVAWGLAEFIAAEEMDRSRGFWWSPDGERLAAARVDNRPVRSSYVCDPTEPASEPRAIRYPVAGSDNAVVTMSVFDAAGGDRTDVAWDLGAFPYLARVSWSRPGPLTLLVQSRDQRRTAVLEVDDRTGATTEAFREADPAWVELVDGSPTRTDDGRLVTAADREGARALLVDGEVASPPGVQVRSIVAAGRDAIVIASELGDPTTVDVLRISLSEGAPASWINARSGVSGAAADGDLVVVTTRVEDSINRTFSVLRMKEGAEPEEVAMIGCFVEDPSTDPRPTFFSAEERDIRCALLLPAGTRRPGPLPVMLDPYGGPHHQRVLRAPGVFLTSQWFADCGFAVLVADGRGTPGRGSEWERSIQGDLSIALEDQVDALRAAAELHPGVLDLSRVAIRGWSFGGYLAALGVLRRPDVFHAAIAGAPVTDWRLYDTHYTERYLGMPEQHPDSYRASSLEEGAANLSRPLLLVHGMSDDNVVVANTLRLSSALFEAGRHHELLLLPDVTHIAGACNVEEKLLLLELDFLRRSLRGLG